jgi:tetratricopeptide (TPR) repeat protein
MPLDARLSEDGQVHLPWAFEKGVANAIAALPSTLVPTQGTTERASAESAGRLDEFIDRIGARLVVFGTVVSQRGGAALTVRILERGADAPRWEREFIYPQSTLASIEDQIVAEVAQILGTGKPLESGRIADAMANDELARGDFFLAQHDVWAGDSARAAYERALLRLPESGFALGRLARAYAVSLERRGRVGPLGQLAALREGSAIVDRALKADSSIADAWTARAIFERVRDPKTYAGAIAAHEKAVRVAPRNADAHQEYAITLLRLGRDEAAEAQVRQALAIERDRAVSLRLLAELEYLARRYANACALVNASIGADSYDPLAYDLRARVRVRMDEFRDAFSDAETARRLTGATWGETLEFYVSAYAREIDAAKADSRRLSKVKLKAGNTLAVRDAVYLGMGLAVLGTRDKAFDALSRARPRGAELRSALRDPGFDQLRSDPRFSRVGVEPPSTGSTSGTKTRTTRPTTR